MGDFRPTLISFKDRTKSDDLECHARRNDPTMCVTCKLRYRCYTQRETNIEVDVSELMGVYHENDDPFRMPYDIKNVADWLWGRTEKLQVTRKNPSGYYMVLESRPPTVRIVKTVEDVTEGL
jgi:hypothetical protein